MILTYYACYLSTTLSTFELSILLALSNCLPTCSNVYVLPLVFPSYFIVALETTSRSVTHSEVDYRDKKVALIVGNELMGVDTRMMDAADVIVQVPTYGVKNSLNVAAALPVVLFEVLRQCHLPK